MRSHELAKALLEMPDMDITVSSDMSLNFKEDPKELTHGNRNFSNDICELIPREDYDEVVIVMGVSTPNFEFSIIKNAWD